MEGVVVFNETRTIARQQVNPLLFQPRSTHPKQDLPPAKFELGLESRMGHSFVFLIKWTYDSVTES